MDHPVVEKIERTGFPFKPTYTAFDSLGYPISKGDPVLKLNGKVFAEESLSIKEQIILSECGAIETEA